MSKKFIINPITLILSFSIILISSSAFSAGFYVRESSVVGLGTTFAGVTSNTNDPSTVFFNPAGLTEFDRPEASVGTHLIVLNGGIDDKGTVANGVVAANFDLAGNGGEAYDPAVVPNLYIALPINDRLGFGFGLNSPFGLKNEYDNPWFGRYDSTANELLTIYTTFGLGYKAADWISVGGSVNIIYTKAVLENSFPNVAVNPGSSATDFQQKLEGDDVTAGLNFAVLLKPLEGTKIGIQYKTKTIHNLDGDLVTVNQNGAVINNFSLPKVSASVTFPDIVQLGIEQQITDSWKVMANIDWFNWSVFDELVAKNAGPAQAFIPLGVIQTGQAFLTDEQGYRDTVTVSLGTEIDLSDCFTIRGGMSYDPTPTVNEHRSTRIPDADRFWIGLGASYEVMEGVVLDAAWAHIFADTPDIHRVKNFGGLGNVVVNGEIDVSGDIFSLAARFKL